jgi:hypothetical protein
MQNCLKRTSLLDSRCHRPTEILSDRLGKILTNGYGGTKNVQVRQRNSLMKSILWPTIFSVVLVGRSRVLLD